MVALKNDKIEPVSLAEIAGKTKLIDPENPLVIQARKMGTSFGD
jgi:6-phosphofructokinase 1